MLRDALEHVAQISFRVDIVEPSCADQGIDAGSALSPGIGAGE
jgi:hypothetical protein